MRVTFSTRVFWGKVPLQKWYKTLAEESLFPTHHLVHSAVVHHARKQFEARLVERSVAQEIFGFLWLNIWQIYRAFVTSRQTDTTNPAYFSGSLREKLEFSHADEAALSALFEEFGSARYAYFEPDHSGAKTLSASIVSAVIVLACLLLVRWFWETWRCCEITVYSSGD